MGINSNSDAAKASPPVANVNMAAVEVEHTRCLSSDASNTSPTQNGTSAASSSEDIDMGFAGDTAENGVENGLANRNAMEEGGVAGVEVVNQETHAVEDEEEEEEEEEEFPNEPG